MTHAPFERPPVFCGSCGSTLEITSRTYHLPPGAAWQYACRRCEQAWVIESKPVDALPLVFIPEKEPA
jgi:hypothetical protein